jgi:DegV family protein with EDD domain
MRHNSAIESQTVGVVTDSVACLPQPLIEQYGIHVIPVRLAVAGHVYRDTDEELPAARVRELQQAPTIETTPWSPDVYCREYLEAGRTSSVLVHIVAFSQFTSTISLARAGAAMAQEARPGLSVTVLDSASTAMSQGFVALSAARAAAQGGDAAEVISAAERVRSTVELAFTLDSLRYIARTGRVTRLAAWAGSLLNVRPVVGLSQGKERPIGLVRSRAKGAARLLELIRTSPDGSEPLHVAIIASPDVEEWSELQDAVEKQLDPAESLVVRPSAVAQIVAGPGLLGVAFYRGN